MNTPLLVDSRARQPSALVAGMLGHVSPRRGWLLMFLVWVCWTYCLVSIAWIECRRPFDAFRVLQNVVQALAGVGFTAFVTWYFGCHTGGFAAFQVDTQDILDECQTPPAPELKLSASKVALPPSSSPPSTSKHATIGFVFIVGGFSMLHIGASLSETLANDGWRDQVGNDVLELGFAVITVWTQLAIAIILVLHYVHCRSIQVCFESISSLCTNYKQHTLATHKLRKMRSMMERHKRHWNVCSAILMAATGMVLLELRSTRDAASTWETWIQLGLGIVVWPALLLYPAIGLNSQIDELISLTDDHVQDVFDQDDHQLGLTELYKIDKQAKYMMRLIDNDLPYNILDIKVTLPAFGQFFAVYTTVVFLILEWL